MTTTPDPIVSDPEFQRLITIRDKWGNELDAANDGAHSMPLWTIHREYDRAYKAVEDYRQTWTAVNA